jgi:hypothetical protein
VLASASPARCDPDLPRSVHESTLLHRAMLHVQRALLPFYAGLRHAPARCRDRRERSAIRGVQPRILLTGANRRGARARRRASWELVRGRRARARTSARGRCAPTRHGDHAHTSSIGAETARCPTPTAPGGLRRFFALGGVMLVDDAGVSSNDGEARRLRQTARRGSSSCPVDADHDRRGARRLPQLLPAPPRRRADRRATDAPGDRARRTGTSPFSSSRSGSALARGPTGLWEQAVVPGGDAQRERAIRPRRQRRASPQALLELQAIRFTPLPHAPSRGNASVLPLEGVPARPLRRLARHRARRRVRLGARRRRRRTASISVVHPAPSRARTPARSRARARRAVRGARARQVVDVAARRHVRRVGRNTRAATGGCTVTAPAGGAARVRGARGDAGTSARRPPRPRAAAPSGSFRADLLGGLTKRSRLMGAMKPVLTVNFFRSRDHAVRVVARQQ